MEGQDTKMAYTINKTDGSKLAEVADGTINSAASSITLIGKNFSGFGELLNENLVKMLENFANVASPSGNPIAGQLWFDTGLNSLKVYTGNEWRTIGSATLADNPPGTLRDGDLWFNTLKQQLQFRINGNDIVVAPQFSSAQGESGVIVETIKGASGRDYTVLKMSVSGILLGIISKEPFTAKDPIDQFTGTTIQTGFNLASFSDSANFKFRATATNADRLGGTLADSFVRKDADSIISAELTAINGIRVGQVNSSLSLVSVNGYATISNTANNLPLEIGVRATGDVQTVILMDPTTETLSLYPSRLTSSVEVGGSLVVDGDLTVKGTTTTITTNELIVKDKLIELNRPEIGSVSDEDADGGGISLAGDTDHTITWDLASLAWEFSENVNIPADRAYYVGGIKVLGQGDAGLELSDSVVSAPVLTSFGTQVAINVGPTNNDQILRITSNVISTLVDGTDITLDPANANVALIGNPKITGVGTPTSDQDATNKVYVDTLVTSRNFAFSLDVTGLTDTAIIGILNDIAPVNEYFVGAIARISTTRQVEGSVTYTPTINKTLVDVTGTDNIDYSVLRDVAIPAATIAPGAISVVRGLKQFQVQLSGPTKTWVHVSTEDNITYPRP